MDLNHHFQKSFLQQDWLLKNTKIPKLRSLVASSSEIPGIDKKILAFSTT